DLLGAHPAHVGKRAVDCADHVGEADLVARPREPVAAVGAAPARDETGVSEVDEDVLEEVRRDRLRLGDPFAFRGPGACRGELDGRAVRVARLGGAPHAAVPPKASTRIRILHTSRNPSRARIGLDIGEACVTSAGVPRATASSQRAWTSALYAPRPRASGSVDPPNSVTPYSENEADARATGSPSAYA